MVKAQTSVAPCPFCGSRGAAIDTLNYTSGNPGRFRVWCEGCCATSWRESKGEAWAAWNARAPAPVQAQKAAPAVPTDIYINKNLFFHGGVLYARNPKTGYCYIGGNDGVCKRINKDEYLLCYEQCAKAAGKA